MNFNRRKMPALNGTVKRVTVTVYVRVTVLLHFQQEFFSF